VINKQIDIQEEKKNIYTLLSPQPLRINTLRDFLVIWISLPFWTYVLLVAYFGPPEAFVYRTIFLTFLLVICFLVKPFNKDSINTFNKYTIIDIILILITIFIQIYILWDYKAFQMRLGFPEAFDKVIGFLAILLVLEAARRVLGWAIVTIAVVFLIMIRFANFLPWIFRAPSVSNKLIISTIFMGFDGIYGIPIGVISSIVALFVLFGTLLLSTKVADVFIDLSLSLAGKSPGGPAKVAVIASGLTGTISGSGVANVLTTGSFTIPMMKKIGYSSVFAGAVEAVASTGGMLMPPVMGAAAFIIAEFLGIPYIEVCKAALIPAILYYLACFIAVHLRAKQRNLKGLPPEKIPNLIYVLKNQGYLLIPLLIIIIVLIQGLSPTRACMLGIVALLFLSFFKKKNRLSPIDLLRTFEQASRNLLSPGIGCACAGIIIGCVFVGGLGPKFVTILLTLSQGKLFLMLLFTMIASIILGMGLTATAVYITVFFITIPALTNAGVMPIGAHLFAYIFGIISGITPPVALVAFAAAGISGANANKTGWNAFLIGLPVYIIPFSMIYFPELLMIGTPFAIISSTLICILAIYCITCGTIGFLLTELKLLERIGLVFAGIITFFQGWYVLIGLLSLILIASIKIKNKKNLLGERN